MDATTIISAVGLLFAAVAARAAWMTVRLTQQMRREDNVRMLIDAVLAVWHAAEDLSYVVNVERKERLLAAQRELERTGTLRPSFSAPIADLQKLPQLFALLTAPDAYQHPQDVMESARTVATILTPKPSPTRMQRWWTAVQWFVKYARHPRTWRAYAELRRGWTSGPRQ